MINDDPTLGPFPDDFQRLPERLRNKIRIDELTGCWIWTGATEPKGYGRISKETYGEKRVHRLAWKLLVGPAPPVLHHRCKNPSCCNPWHLKAENDNLAHAQEHLRVYCPSGRHLMSESAYRASDGKRRCRLCKLEYYREYDKIRRQK